MIYQTNNLSEIFNTIDYESAELGMDKLKSSLTFLGIFTRFRRLERVY